VKYVDKYKNDSSAIKPSDESKNNLIEKMNEKQAENNIKTNIRYAKKNKIRKTITSIVGIIGILLGGGLAYAGITGNFKFGDTGIEFSQNIEEYQVEENQSLESNGNIIELTSKVCDDGFVILQFNVTLSNEQSQSAEETCGLQYISFNDDIVNENGYEDTRLAGSNYNLIIDGEEYWLRGSTDSQIITNIENKNYTCYQLWFLSDTEIGDKEEFTITLDDVRLMVGENLINFDGKFEVELSKTKALDNTKTYELNNIAINYERLTANVEKIIESPIQTLIKVRRTLDDVTSKNFVTLSEDDYVGDLKYEVYDQNGNQISEYNVITKYVYYYKDGTIKESDNEEGIEYDGFYKYDTEEYIVIAQNDAITNLTVEVFEVNEYKGITRNIGEYDIDLTKGTVVTLNY
jgi:hypothetical protein